MIFCLIIYRVNIVIVFCVRKGCCYYFFEDISDRDVNVLLMLFVY